MDKARMAFASGDGVGMGSSFGQVRRLVKGFAAAVKGDLEPHPAIAQGLCVPHIPAG